VWPYKKVNAGGVAQETVDIVEMMKELKLRRIAADFPGKYIANAYEWIRRSGSQDRAAPSCFPISKAARIIGRPERGPRRAGR